MFNFKANRKRIGSMDTTDFQIALRLRDRQVIM